MDMQSWEGCSLCALSARSTVAERDSSAVRCQPWAEAQGDLNREAGVLNAFITDVQLHPSVPSTMKDTGGD